MVTALDCESTGFQGYGFEPHAPGTQHQPVYSQNNVQPPVLYRLSYPEIWNICTPERRRKKNHTFSGNKLAGGIPTSSSRVPNYGTICQTTSKLSIVKICIKEKLNNGLGQKLSKEIITNIFFINV